MVFWKHNYIPSTETMLKIRGREREKVASLPTGLSTDFSRSINLQWFVYAMIGLLALATAQVYRARDLVEDDKAGPQLCFFAPRTRSSGLTIDFWL